MIKLESDWSDIKKELRRLKRIPTGADKRRLDMVLRFGLAQAKSIVHIDTGSLYASGKKESSMKGGWYSGHFEFGGSSKGSVHDPVDYAIYEAERGGPHNFMSGVDSLHPLWIKAIQDILEGKKI